MRQLPISSRSLMIKLVWCFYQALRDTIKHDGNVHAGYLAFLSLLSLFPFLVFLAAIAGIFSASVIESEFVNVLLSNLPTRAADALQPHIKEILSGPPHALLTLAVAGTIWTASTTVEALRTVINRAYHVHDRPAYIFRRLLSVAQFIMLTIAIIVVMGVMIFFPLIMQYMVTKMAGVVDLAPFINSLWNYVRYCFIILTLFIGVSALYVILPNTSIRWRYVMPGAAMVVATWLIAAVIYSRYLDHVQQLSAIYGSLGGVIVALIFFYILNAIFIYGAEFNYQLWRLFHPDEEEEEDPMI